MALNMIPKPMKETHIYSTAYSRTIITTQQPHKSHLLTHLRTTLSFTTCAPSGVFFALHERYSYVTRIPRMDQGITLNDIGYRSSFKALCYKNRRSRVRFPMKSLDFFFNLSNPSRSTMALGFTQTLIEWVTEDLSEGKAQPARKADNLTAICEPAV
jgi:hypothetical protein